MRRIKFEMVITVADDCRVDNWLVDAVSMGLDKTQGEWVESLTITGEEFIDQNDVLNEMAQYHV